MEGKNSTESWKIIGDMLLEARVKWGTFEEGQKQQMKVKNND